MITTSKGFLGSFIKEEEDQVVAEDFNFDENLDLLIKEDCGDITIGEWAFLQEGDVDDVKVQLLEEVLDEIDSDLLEADKFFESLKDEDNELLNEAVKATMKKVAGAVGAKAKVAAKAAAAKGKIISDKIRAAAKVASTKAKEYAKKARELAKKGATAAADKAKNMASKMAAKASTLRDKVKEVISRYKNKKA